MQDLYHQQYFESLEFLFSFPTSSSASFHRLREQDFWMALKEDVDRHVDQAAWQA